MKKFIFLMGVFMSTLLYTTVATSSLITHDNTFKNIDLKFQQDILKNKENLSLPLKVELDLLNQLSMFDLGRFLLVNKGLNGYWTAYIILHGPGKKNLHPLEKWILHSAPAVKATRERFKIFREILQKNVKDGIRIASIPCGLMDDLLGLDYRETSNISLIGIDLDAKSIALAKENALMHGYTNVEFYTNDAWNSAVHDEYNVITSNGLNIYEPDDKKVIRLYREFYKALKVNGLLITSFLTPPPALSKESSWRNFNPGDMLKQKAIFSDIIGASWQAFRTEQQTRAQLEKAGFTVLEVVYDSQGMFPTVIAKKC